MGVIYFNGISSKDVGLVVENPPVYKTPEREYESYHVPGRNGDILVDTGSYKNVTRSYDVAFGSLCKMHAEMASVVSAWLHPLPENDTLGGSWYPKGYFRLEDSYEPEYYRMAYCKNEIEFENTLNHLGRATIEFECMPQRFLKSGEKVIELKKITDESESFTINNPTGFISCPKIILSGGNLFNSDDRWTIRYYYKEYGYVSLVISGFVTGIDDIQIDSELENIQCPRGSNVSWYNDDMRYMYPLFYPGKNKIIVYGNLTTVKIYPRWWAL